MPNRKMLKHFLIQEYKKYTTCIGWKHVTKISLLNRLLAIVTTNLGIGQDRKLFEIFNLDTSGPDGRIQTQLHEKKAFGKNMNPREVTGMKA